MEIRFVALDTEDVRDLQNGGRDAYGNAPEQAVSDGGRIPCRHCLQMVEAGEPYLILAHRPFAKDQPYAETGPIFLHARECARAEDSPIPARLYRSGGEYILRGYRENDWINYGTAQVVSHDKIVDTAKAMLERDDVAYVHMRSSRYNCFQCRIKRA